MRECHNKFLSRPTLAGKTWLIGTRDECYTPPGYDAIVAQIQLPNKHTRYSSMMNCTVPFSVVFLAITRTHMCPNRPSEMCSTLPLKPFQFLSDRRRPKLYHTFRVDCRILFLSLTSQATDGVLFNCQHSVSETAHSEVNNPIKIYFVS